MDPHHARDIAHAGQAREWKGVRVVVLGLARQGKALARFLCGEGADVVISDLKPADLLVEARQELADLKLSYVLGGHQPSLLDGADLLCLSGGVPADLPLAQQAREQGIPVENDSQIFMEACPAPVIGVTGSAGKTTTTTLMGRIADAHYAATNGRAWVGGNIGRPLLMELSAIQPDDLVILELSSFQLELMTISPHIAAVLNVTPNHLDRHHTMEAYTAAKARILDYQDAHDVAVLGRDDRGAWNLRDRVKGRLISYGWEAPVDGDGVYMAGDTIVLHTSSGEQALLPCDAVELRGEHNLLNVMAACALAASVGIASDAIEAGVRGFSGVPHRLEFVRRVGGADWYNDSIATAPERAIAAIRVFDEPLILLAGGRDKDLPWQVFARVACERVRDLVLFGEAAGKIADAIEEVQDADCVVHLELCKGFDQAVEAAAKLAQPGDVILLAPGGTSFDEFADFEARGERFRELVKALE